MESKDCSKQTIALSTNKYFRKSLISKKNKPEFFNPPPFPTEGEHKLYFLT